MSEAGRAEPRERRWRSRWDQSASSYDRQMTAIERRVFRDTRAWVAGRARGHTLEVAIGTGLNLPHYPPGIRLTGIEWSAAMLGVARRRAADHGVDADLRVGDARTLPLPDASVDTAVATFSMCAIPDHEVAVAEMIRVLRPGGLLVLADHVASSHRWGRGVQAGLDALTNASAGEHWRRRPLPLVEGMGLVVEEHDRWFLGVAERFTARRPD